MKNIFYTQLCLLCAWLVYIPIHAQDIHYTQFPNAPFAINPALTGVFKEDVLFMINYRRQWFSVVDYETFSAEANLKLLPYRPNRNGFFALGVSINRDQAGLSKLTLVKVGLSGSYNHRLSENAFLSLGIHSAFSQRTFSLNNVLFGRQYDPSKGLADPALANGETNFNEANDFFSMGTGLNLRIQRPNQQASDDNLKYRSKLDVGFGLSNLNRPDQSFEGVDKTPLPVRFSPYVLSVLKLKQEKSKFDLVLNALAQIQQKYVEGVGMVGLRYHLSQVPGDRKALQISGAVRLSDNPDNNVDAIAPVIKFFVNEWQFGISYDINVSPFSAATNRNGSLDFSFRYGITKVKVSYPQHCRIF